MNTSEVVDLEKLINYSDLNYPSTKLHIKIQNLCADSEFCYFDLTSKIQKIKELHKLVLNKHSKRNKLSTEQGMLILASNQKVKATNEEPTCTSSSNYHTPIIEDDMEGKPRNKITKQLSLSDMNNLEVEYTVDPTDAFTYDANPNKCNGSKITKDCIACELKSR